jgi:hypothetical protein
VPRHMLLAFQVEKNNSLLHVRIFLLWPNSKISVRSNAFHDLLSHTLPVAHSFHYYMHMCIKPIMCNPHNILLTRLAAQFWLLHTSPPRLRNISIFSHHDLLKVPRLMHLRHQPTAHCHAPNSISAHPRERHPNAPQ